MTIVTADFANSIFGGLYGSGESVDLDPDDPRIRGHVHDARGVPRDRRHQMVGCVACRVLGGP